ncbi:hypothetical protein ACFY2M_26230 [Streptomyces sp. NPDC001276]|uniref:hypothetical protein n=1 Tax=Streptomyces sp. NPDC001276 TaxID=3364555 RepID=UPI0036AF981E
MDSHAFFSAMVLCWAVTSVSRTASPTLLSCSVTVSSGSFGGASEAVGGGVYP